jgi:hypothetical protein
MVPWPPRIGDPLPRASEAFGVRRKLTTYCLNAANEFGAAKARGFALILEITIDDADYLEAAILSAITVAPITAIRDCAPHGVNCVVEVPVRGLDRKSTRLVNIRTVWRIGAPGDRPHLTTAFPRP